MSRASDERGRRDRDARRRAAERLAAEVLAAELLGALERGDLTGFARILGPGPRILVDSGDGMDGEGLRQEDDADAWRVLIQAMGLGGAQQLNWTLRSVNGSPGLAGSRFGAVVRVVVFAGCIGRVTDVWIVANPAKLRHWNDGAS